MRIGTANIKNFPDMSPEKVRQDGVTMGQLCHIWGQQENDPRDSDHDNIMKGLGPKWGSVHGDTNLPIYYRKSFADLVSKRVVRVPFDPVLRLVPRPRLITGAVFKLDDRLRLPSFAVVDGHFIAGAMNSPDPDPDRVRQWRIEWEFFQDFVRDYKRQGLTVFVLADFNHPRPPKPVGDFQWLVGPRLDRIGVTTTGSVRVNELEDGAVRLNSDHNGQWTRVHLTR